ncbi:6-bladed beta-propeller [Belliella marina]|uniref:6-bladed beta-propeller n=1 Tax=Belliella marina TaxID=1644146 RepID=A0ABW4VN77_9BACT
MKSNYLLILSVFFCFVICSCGSNKNSDFGDLKNSEEIIALSLNGNWGKNEEKFTSLFIDYEVIPLKVPDSLFIVSIDKIHLSDDRIYVLDKKFSNLFCFNILGEFIGQVGSIGSGPGEFLGIEDFNIFEDNIILMSSGDMSFFVYDKFNFDFRKQYSLGLFGYSFVPLSLDKTMIYINHNPSSFGGNYNLFISDKDLKNPKGFFPFDPKKSYAVIDFSGFLTFQNEKILFAKPFDDLIYEFNSIEEDFNPIFKLETISEFVLENKEDFSKVVRPDILTNAEHKTSFMGSTFFMNEDFLVFDYHYKSRIFYGIYSLNKNLFKSFSKSSKDPLFKLLSKPIYLEEDRICFTFSSEAYVDFIKKYPQDLLLSNESFNEINNSPNDYYLVFSQINFR